MTAQSSQIFHSDMTILDHHTSSVESSLKQIVTWGRKQERRETVDDVIAYLQGLIEYLRPYGTQRKTPPEGGAEV